MPVEKARVVPLKAACASCFVSATIDVAATAAAGSRAETLALRALERELRGQGCGHRMPQVVGPRPQT